MLVARFVVPLPMPGLEKKSRENYEPYLQLSHGRSLYYGQIGSLVAQLWNCCLQPKPPFYALVTLFPSLCQSVHSIRYCDQRSRPCKQHLCTARQRVCSTHVFPETKGQTEVLFTWSAAVLVLDSNSKVAQHANQFVHSVDLNHATVVDEASNFHKRLFQNSILTFLRGSLQKLRRAPPLT